MNSSLEEASVLEEHLHLSLQRQALPGPEEFNFV